MNIIKRGVGKNMVKKKTEEYDKLNEILNKLEQEIGAKLRAMEPWKLD
jgi:hypothetical protein